MSDDHSGPTTKRTALIATNEESEADDRVGMRVAVMVECIAMAGMAVHCNGAAAAAAASLPRLSFVPLVCAATSPPTRSPTSQRIASLTLNDHTAAATKGRNNNDQTHASHICTHIHLHTQSRMRGRVRPSVRLAAPQRTAAAAQRSARRPPALIGTNTFTSRTHK